MATAECHWESWTIFSQVLGYGQCWAWVPSIERALNPVRQWLVTLTTTVPQLHQQITQTGPQLQIKGFVGVFSSASIQNNFQYHEH